MKSKLLLTIMVLLLLTPKTNFGQAPTLGTAANFVLFSTVGAVTNTGITHLTGNVGTNSGLSTGFGNVDGSMHDGDGVSALCSADLLIAYNQLNVAVPTFFPAPLLGGGATLIPGVYLIPAAATLDLDLILDGQGDPTSVFIFQIQGPFSTNANSKVKLINGALACNVFWKVEGLVSMAAGTSMKGTIVANNAAINMSTNDTLEGRALSTAGAITTDGILAYTPIGCGSPVLVGPIEPNLASIGCYAIFSSIGPVTNVGVTYVTGDIGSDNGLTTGYNPLFVTGAIHPIPDGSTAACATDLITVYNYLNTLPFDIELLYPAQFGNNLVLTPHTYVMNAAVTFTDTLYLNAQGDPNAVFVIQINGALSTSTYAKVILINGAQASKVFWKVEGAVTINDYSIFNGTIICNNGAVDVNTGATINGRVLTTTGAVNTSAVFVTVPVGTCGTLLPPVIVTEPTNQSTCTGGSVSFSVTATGTGLTYQWRKGTTNLVDGGNISGATTATLTINPVTIADTAFNYNVIVSGPAGPNDTSAYVSLTITSAPVITLEPMNQSACAGGSVSFVVAASGSGLTYQWRKGIVNLVDGGNISGATTATLTINPVSITDTAFNYNVIITGACALNDTSINASLIITTSPIITIEPMNQTACAGGSVSFIVAASGSGLTYQWRKGIINLVDGGNISGATTATLTINPTSISDTAFNYNVIISGGCTSNDTSINVSLMLNPATTITSEPLNQTACLGSSVSFTTAATGSTLTYQWRKGIVNLIDGGSISGATTATLTINPVIVTDAALNYNVIVMGGCAPNDTSANASLIITTAPIITSEPINQTVCSGNSVSFTTVSLGAGLSYQWRKGIVNLVDGGNISGATTATLTINPVGISDAALNYNVIIMGACAPNDTSINASLTVNATPVAVANSNSPICTGDSISLTATTVSGATYSWTSTTGYTSTAQNPTIGSASITNSGNYTLIVTANGCVSTPSTIAVVVNDCFADLSVVKTVNNSTPFWGATVTFTIVATNNGPGNATGVEVIEMLQSGFAYLSSTTSAGTYNSTTGIWTIGTLIDGASETLTITATVIEGGNYVNTAIIYGDAFESDMTNNNSSIELFPTDFFIPEGFSPNGDGINDVFFIRGISNYPKNTITIFNRWGNKVFGANPYENTWDGKCAEGISVGGNELPIGTYFYILDLGNDTDIIKGTIYLNK